MKILHIGNLKSGIDTYVRNTIALACDDFTFVIVKGADDRSEPYFRKGNEVKTYEISMYRALNPFKDFKAIRQTVKIIKNEKPDLIHCHSAKGGVIGRIAAFLTGTKVAYTAHAFSFLSANSKIKQSIFILFEKVTRLKSFLVACSGSELELGVKRIKYSPKKAFVWNNAIPKINDTDVVEPAEDVKNQRFIISVGRPCYQKNPLLMVETMRMVNKKYPDVLFYLLGVGFYSPMLDEMKQLISKYGLENNIRLIEWLNRNEVLGYLKYAYLYLTTSLYEGLPIAVLEAMAMGKAIVSSDVIGNNDCIKDQRNGYLLPFDAKKISDAICDLLDNDEKRINMGNVSKEIFMKDFYINNRISELENIYKTILS
ncbi:MAG: glycosyltransferase family 4 protein [Bacteroidales bacterium]|nr:glycosyltransferase family 4 protein [Bacteroidales bacterium]